MTTLPRLALVDIDGVLANDSKRVQYALSRTWHEYFKPERMKADTVWPQGLKLINNLQNAGWQIEYLTGRRDDRHVLTFDWLLANGYPWAALHTRPFSVSKPLANLKTEFVGKALDSGRFRNVVLFDDDPEVIRRVQDDHGLEHGVHCTWHIKQKALVKTAVA